MDVKGKDVIVKFTRKHADVTGALHRWMSLVELAKWPNFAQVRDTFRNADLYTQDGNNYVIFNIGGNKYRLVTEIDYSGALVIVDVAMMHAEYSKDKWKGRL